LSKIQLADTAHSMVMKMCEGNPGALRILCECLKEGAAIDPDWGGMAITCDLSSCIVEVDGGSYTLAR